MTVMAVRATPTYTAIDWPEHATPPISATPTRTTVEAGIVANSVLRDALELTEQWLAPMVNLHRELRVSYLGTAQSLVRCTVDLVGAAAELSGPYRWRVNEDTVDALATTAAARFTGESDVVGAVRWLATVLGVPDGDVLTAAQIKPRNWHNWQGGRQPRLSTQGQLWSLVHTIRSIEDLLGSDLRGWMQRGGEDRRQALRSGAYTTLLNEALREQVSAGRFDDPRGDMSRDRYSVGNHE